MKKINLKKQKKMFVLMVMILGLFAGVFETSASDYVKSTQLGVVDFEGGDAVLTVKGNAGQSLKGKTFYIYRLLEAKNAKGSESINYSLNSTYESVLMKVVGERLNKEMEDVTEYEIIDYMDSMNSYAIEGAEAQQETEGSYSEYRYFAEDVLEEIHASGIKEIEVQVTDTTAENTVEIKGLPFGYYMVEDATEAAGQHTAVSMPMLTTANSQATMEIKADYPILIKKLREDDLQEEIGMDGWNDIGDYEIKQSIPYQFNSSVPDLNGYETYYYAWHDVMDEALTFLEGSVRIAIIDTSGEKSKEYRLQENEYKVNTQVENETFVIEIEDLKAIIDREFNNMNENQENIYGQYVSVMYRAYLNESAITDMGAPGFENEVRLEFSNNPNTGGEKDTGFTPWDTTVCFTYGIKGVKVNNHGKKLQGAEFVLRYDTKYMEEVYVKEVEGGYCVINSDNNEELVPHASVPMVSDENGEINIFGLDSGTYFLEEINAPEGYRTPVDAIEIEIKAVFPEDRNNYVKDDGGKEHFLTLTSTAAKYDLLNKTSGESSVLSTNTKEGTINLTVVNQVGKKLPITGSYLMPFLVITGVSFMALSLRKGRKKHA